MRGFGSSLSGLAIAIVLISLPAVIVSMPLALGLGVNLVDLIGEVPAAIVLCAPMALQPLRVMSGASTDADRNA